MNYGGKGRTFSFGCSNDEKRKEWMTNLQIVSSTEMNRFGNQKRDSRSYLEAMKKI